jgi:hypothetical protein
MGKAKSNALEIISRFVYDTVNAILHTRLGYPSVEVRRFFKATVQGT